LADEAGRSTCAFIPKASCRSNLVDENSSSAIVIVLVLLNSAYTIQLEDISIAARAVSNALTIVEALGVIYFWLIKWARNCAARIVWHYKAETCRTDALVHVVHYCYLSVITARRCGIWKLLDAHSLS